ncbi:MULTISPECIES: hypothetical protein [unclassified Novosphingobium]|uniref:hypothetical protein n=1 Tax=unclassified Novosphingobium TaxID=2644732 RepID=UPI0025D5B5D5|nr:MULTISPECIES: hypothetical protein [unclassified Novosphingobium]HQV03701.1 hypothetical protein [Novosphingobium sp.]
MDHKRGIQGVLLTLAAWGCFQGMESVPANSALETALLIGGYALIALALAVFYLAFRNRPS